MRAYNRAIANVFPDAKQHHRQRGCTAEINNNQSGKRLQGTMPRQSSQRPYWRPLMDTSGKLVNYTVDVLDIGLQPVS